MADPQALDAQAERLAQAKATLKAREQGIHANGVKQGRQAERTEILAQLGAKAIEDVGMIATVRTEHAKELQSLAFHYGDTTKLHRAAGYHRGVTHAGLAAIVLLAAAVYGSYEFGVQTQLNTVAAMNAVRAPRGLQLPAPDPSEQGFR